MKPLNTAQQIRDALNIPFSMEGNGGKNFSYTKKGPGRKHQIKSIAQLDKVGA